MPNPLIVGIDPGTTLGYAALDLNGNLRLIGSSKNLKPSDLINILISAGKPVIMGCDVSPAPSYVKEISAKLGTKLIQPKKDMLVREKRELTSKFRDKTSNYHEMDSLAAALFAYKSTIPTLTKVKRFLENKRNRLLFNELAEFRILNEGYNLETAYNILTFKPEEIIPEIRISEKEVYTKDEYLKLNELLKKARKAIEILQHTNNRLKSELRNNDNHKIKHAAKPLQEKELEKEKTIQNLAYNLRLKNIEAEELNKKLNVLKNIMVNIKNKEVIRVFKDLGFEAYKALRQSAMQDEILFVKNPNIMSENTLEIIKDKVRAIIYGQTPSDKNIEALPFTLIDSDNIIFEQFDNIIIADKQSLMQELNRKEAMISIVESYQRSRIKTS